MGYTCYVYWLQRNIVRRTKTINSCEQQEGDKCYWKSTECHWKIIIIKLKCEFFGVYFVLCHYSKYIPHAYVSLFFFKQVFFVFLRFITAFLRFSSVHVNYCGSENTQCFRKILCHAIKQKSKGNIGGWLVNCTNCCILNCYFNGQNGMAVQWHTPETDRKTTAAYSTVYKYLHIV